MVEAVKVDLEDLERVAMKAMPGGWAHAGRIPGRRLLEQVWDQDGRSLADLYFTDDPGVATARAAHIAASNPAVVLALVAEHKATLAKLARAKEGLREAEATLRGWKFGGSDRVCIALADALKATIKALEQG